MGKNDVSTRQASDALGITMRMVRWLCERGRLKGAALIGGVWIIPRKALELYVPTKRGRKSAAQATEEEPDGA
jgi:hypothetical protein